jgi:hypothetical protein
MDPARLLPAFSASFSPQALKFGLHLFVVAILLFSRHSLVGNSLLEELLASV